jgi:glucosamine--fructose-6-phosphate aminotransferase (isomerizing)
MCGIVGYVGSKEAAPVLLNALAKLEYRGYDSAGLATVVNGNLYSGKDAGTLNEVAERHHLNKLPGTTGIGHTRWATHGEVSAKNAHPHFDCTGRIAVVHNGIIDNFQELRERLGKSHHFVSETDSEVIPHLIEGYINSGNTLAQAVQALVKELEGSYAILAISAAEPDIIVAACNRSPLAVGFAGHGIFISSDVLSFHNEIKNVLFIEDGECVFISADKTILLDSSGNIVQRLPKKIDPSNDAITKGNYNYFMLKEIHE